MRLTPKRSSKKMQSTFTKCRLGNKVMTKGVLILSTVFLLGVIAMSVGRNDPTPPKPATVAVAPVPAEDFKISIEATPISQYEVSLNVKTNIPLPVEVMASVSIKGQNPKDTYIGVSQRIKLTSPEQTVKLDGKSENLPSGEYLAEVTFYPKWGVENGSAEAKRINAEIIGQADVTLSGSGANKTQTDAQNIAQKWVMLNVDIGMPWNEGQFVAKLGKFSKSASDLNLHDAYYFEDADMTIIVSRVKNTVAVWRMGRATK